MKRSLGIWWLLMCVACAAHAQQGNGRKEKYVVVPPELGLITIAWQPDCPVQFEDVKSLRGVEGGGGGIVFQLRNRGKKPIRDLSYAWLTPEYSGAGGSWPTKVTGEVAWPGQLVPMGEGNYEIVPLTEELRDKLKLRGPMRGVAILMITKVTFVDGTVYDARPAYKAFSAYIANLAGAEYVDDYPEDEDSKAPKKQ